MSPWQWSVDPLVCCRPRGGLHCTLQTTQVAPGPGDVEQFHLAIVATLSTRAASPLSRWLADPLGPRRLRSACPLRSTRDKGRRPSSGPGWGRWGRQTDKWATRGEGIPPPGPHHLGRRQPTGTAQVSPGAQRTQSTVALNLNQARRVAG